MGRLRERYFRKTTASPEGAFGHHGDCEVFRVDICTCGFLHDLLPLAPDTEALYPDFWPQWNRHQRAIDILFEKKMASSEKASGPRDGN